MVDAPRVTSRTATREPRIEGRVRLASGRELGFAEYGDPTGRAVLWFHGTPGGRRQIPPAARVAAGDLGIRLVALERPGIGASSPHLYPNVLGWAADVDEAADRLGVGRFACVGLSGGGPYVLACAHEHPDRMTAGAVLGGVAPARGPDAISGGLVGVLAPIGPAVGALRVPLNLVLWSAVQCVLPARSLVFDAYVRTSPAGDRLVFGRPGMKEMFLDDLVRAVRRGVGAPLADLVLFAREWGFSPTALRVPIRLWHGDADPIVPLAHGEHLAALIPDAVLRVRPGESHLGGLDAADEVFAEVLALWSGGAVSVR